MIYPFKTVVQKRLSDTNTPVEMYLKLRDKFPNCFLLESSEYKSRENSYSYICLEPLASFVSERETTTLQYPDGKKEIFINADINIADTLNVFTKSFKTDKLDFGFVNSGLFGYTSYDAIPLFEDIEFKNQSFNLPLIQYQFFRYLIVFNHFNNEMFLLEHLQEGETSQIDSINDIIVNRAVTNFGFTSEENETSNFNDKDFLKAIRKGMEHCFLGDVFQVVLSRKFRKKFKGDEFNVYRALRSVNPSSYLFYFDYGDFKIFGSSPEAQLTINNNKALIYPIAGTFKRTGNAEEDKRLAVSLSEDPKENAEHVMLVDLARNDLSRNSHDVKVEEFKQIEYYSHVIHIVSKVSAQLDADYNPVKIFGESYPAGTLSGAPKHKAMQIIDDNEPESRGFYGGAVGIIGFDGSFNHAIFIRSFLSQNNELTYQAGCGIVAKSNPESELQEVNNKLMALRKAIEIANTI
ncbi:anthranilate synthase [Flavobacterium psychrophilum]|nr:anthranilate synthase [Flavobacterium psychrophilum]AOE51584.1 anthranilate synthase [Flavobacterium psychrophilum]